MKALHKTNDNDNKIEGLVNELREKTISHESDGFILCITSNNSLRIDM